MLLNEEKLLLRWLTQYGPIPEALLLQLCNSISARVIQKILRNLKYQGRIVDLPGGYWALDRFAKPNQRMISALWVLAQFKDVDVQAHFPADYPAQILFLKENCCYLILVLYEFEEHLVHLLQHDPDEEMKYVFVLQDKRMAHQIQLPPAPCLFASLAQGDSEKQIVTFYSGGNLYDGE